MRFSYLDGIRGIAALVVVARHWSMLFGTTLHYSYLAVDLFFMMSGFVIAHAYDGKLGSGAMSAREFVLIRISRLYPFYLLAVLFCALFGFAKLAAGGAPNSDYLNWMASALLAAAYIPYAIPGSIALFPVNGVFWSLFMELLVNIAYAWVRPLLNSRVVALVVAVSAGIMVLIGWQTHTLDHGYLRTVTSLVCGAARATFGMGVGLLLYRYRTRLQPLAAMVGPSGAIVLLVLVLTAPPLLRYGAVLDLLAIFVLLPIVVAAAASSEPRPGWQARTMHALGVASYPLYLLHMPFVAVPSVLNKLVPGFGPLIAAGAVALLCWISILLDKYYDLPLRQWLRARLTRGPASMPT